MTQETVLIIGAGVAGLAAGIYAQANGFQSHIFELHDLPGGLCTAWERKGYVFDGCIHYLFGSAPAQPFHDLWLDLGAIQDRPMINHQEFMQVVDPDGREVHAYVDPDRFQDHLLTLAPEDAHAIRSLCQGVRDFTKFDLSLLQSKPRRLMRGQDGLALAGKMMPFVPVLARWGLLSAEDFAMRLRSPLLRRAFPQMFAWPEIPMMAALSLLAYMHTGNAAFPAGGSLEFARAIEQRYLALGGQIHYKAQVEQILVRAGHAVGVRLYDNTEVLGDAVISAADAHATLYEMLDNVYTPAALRRGFAGSLPIRSQMQISLGVNRDLSAEPHWATYLLDAPIQAGGRTHDCLSVKHYCFDPSLAPAGKSVLMVMLPSDYGYWQRIYGRKLYDVEQLQESKPVVEFLAACYPGLCDQIEVTDIATPLSYERYTGNWLGSTCGWLPSKPTMAAMLLGMPKTLPRLRDFWLAGQWVEPGGSVPLAAMSGKNAIQLLCADRKQPFREPARMGTRQPAQPVTT
jgi:phytoene dehydrogenase-like protein